MYCTREYNKKITRPELTFNSFWSATKENQVTMLNN